MDHWTNGPMDHWTNGPMVQWTNRPEVAERLIKETLVTLWNEEEKHYRKALMLKISKSGLPLDIYRHIITIRAPVGANKYIMQYQTSLRLFVRCYFRVYQWTWFCKWTHCRNIKGKLRFYVHSIILHIWVCNLMQCLQTNQTVQPVDLR